MREYLDNGFNEIEGWVAPNLYKSVNAISDIQNELTVEGQVAEIGVHHGRFFLMLDLMRRPEELSLAIDIFEDQYLNVDGSGKGNEQIFLDNVYKHSFDQKSVISWKKDSMTLSSLDLLNLASDRSCRFRLFSIDGGHTVEHTVNDLSLAAGAISSGGVIFLDDYYNSDWPGVHEGFVKYMMNMNRNLAPFAYHGGKLMLCDISHHSIYLKKYSERVRQIGGLRLKPVKMSGFSAVSIR